MLTYFCISSSALQTVDVGSAWLHKVHGPCVHFKDIMGQLCITARPLGCVPMIYSQRKKAAAIFTIFQVNFPKTVH